MWRNTIFSAIWWSSMELITDFRNSLCLKFICSAFQFILLRPLQNNIICFWYSKTTRNTPFLIKLASKRLYQILVFFQKCFKITKRFMLNSFFKSKCSWVQSSPSRSKTGPRSPLPIFVVIFRLFIPEKRLNFGAFSRLNSGSWRTATVTLRCGCRKLENWALSWSKSSSFRVPFSFFTNVTNFAREFMGFDRPKVHQFWALLKIGNLFTVKWSEIQVCKIARKNLTKKRVRV